MHTCIYTYACIYTHVIVMHIYTYVVSWHNYYTVACETFLLAKYNLKLQNTTEDLLNQILSTNFMFYAYTYTHTHTHTLTHAHTIHTHIH